MASLNTLRTKGGIIVTVVIFLALLSFIAQDLFSGGSSMLNSRKMRVGEIDGKNIGYSEFRTQSESISNIYRMMWGREAMSGQEQEMIYNSAWEQFLMQYSYRPSFDNLGLTVSDAELQDMVDGMFISPVLMQTFADPNTGMFDPQALDSFLYRAGTDEGANAIWEYLKSQMIDNRLMTKYMTLVSSGFHVNDVEVANAVRRANESFDAMVISQPFYSVPDSLVKITDSQVREYYKKHKEMFRQGESRDIEYVVFDKVPSEADYLAAEKFVQELAVEFLESETPMQFATLNSQDKPDHRFLREDQLSNQLAALAFGQNPEKMYGPVLNGNVHTMSRVAETRMMPDSLGAMHILLLKTQTALADSIIGVVRRGGDFEQLARQYSIDQSAQYNGGDLGRFAPEQMVTEFSEAAMKANVNDVFTVASQYGLHIVKLTYKSRPVQKVQIATITHRVEPSDQTIQTIYGQANAFLAAAGKTTASFRQAVTDEALSKRSVRIRNTDRTITGLENARELIRWAFNNKKGVVMDKVMEIDGDYLIATLVSVSEAGYTPLEEVAATIRETLRNDAKFEILAKRMSGSSIDAIATELGTEATQVRDVQFGAFYIPELGMEPAVIGAITNSPVNRISRPVKGISGAFVFEVTDIRDTEATTPDAERARLEANAEYYINERLMQAIYEESDVTDMRVKFF